LEVARARLAEAELRLERTVIKAPVGGVVVERFKEPGSPVVPVMDDRSAAAIVSLYDPQKLQVRVDVPLADAALVGVGQKAEIIADVLPDQTYHGRVSRVLHKANIQKNTLEAKVAIADPGPLLRPEMLARVRFLAQREADDDAKPRASLFVPKSALQGDQVWVITGYDGEFGLARPRALSDLGLEREGWVGVGGGLQPGDLVIAPAPSKLKPGTRVKVTLSGA
jgi:HlyD family secretion protein